jgi:AcrR family transcriptional regulator
LSKPDRGSGADDRRLSVIKAGARCFDQFGVAKTSMQDIAETAGITRQALYRIFPDRQAVVDAVLIMRVEELVAAVLPPALAADTFGAGLVEGSLGTIRFVRSTPDLLHVMAETALRHASSHFVRPKEPGLELARKVWQPIIDRGRERGEVRANIDDDDFIEWIASINVMYAAREDIPLDRLRVLLENFLVPAASVDPDAGRRTGTTEDA